MIRATPDSFFILCFSQCLPLTEWTITMKKQRQHTLTHDINPYSGFQYPAPLAGMQLKKEILPFTVRLVQNEYDLNRAIHVRHAAYARHVPEFAESLRQPEPADLDADTVILIAESKLDHSPIGTIRIQTNQFKALELEHSLPLPEWLQGHTQAEATRLGVQGKEGRLVRAALSKAYFQFCQQHDIEWMVVTGRAPVDRDYERMQFKDVYPGMGYMQLKHVGNIPHRILALKVNSMRNQWLENQHPLYNFFFRTRHDDIDTGSRNNNISYMHLTPAATLCRSQKRLA